MSTIKDVTALRHAGRYEEAYTLARQLLREEANEWTCMAMFWVLRDLARLAIELANQGDASNNGTGASNNALGGSDNPATASSNSSKAPNDGAPAEQLEALIAQGAEGVKVDETSGPEQLINFAKRCIYRMSKLSRHMVDDSGMGRLVVRKLWRMACPGFDELQQCAERSKSEPVEAYQQAVAVAGKQGEHIDAPLHEQLGWIICRYLKAHYEVMQPLQVKLTLLNYLKLRNPRPSLLHSQILEFALKFARTTTDFRLDGFLKLWNVDQFRRDDQNDSTVDDKTIYSLRKRVVLLLCSQGLALAAIAECMHMELNEITELWEEQQFWKLHALHKAGQLSDLWLQVDTYLRQTEQAPATGWTVRIVGVAMRHAEGHLSSFLALLTRGSLSGKAWQKQRGQDGKEYAPIAVQAAKRAYDLLKQLQQHDTYLGDKGLEMVASLCRLYDEIGRRGEGDEWTVRQRAILAVWGGDKDDARRRYRKLLSTLGDKYYIWAELADLVEDKELKAGLLMQALLREKNENLTGPIRLKLVEALLSMGCTTPARKLLDAYARHRQQQGKTCNVAYTELDRQIKAASGTDETPLDKQRLKLEALTFAYADCPEARFAVVNHYEVEGKSRLTLSNGRHEFSASSRRLRLDPKIEHGTIVNVRYHINGDRIIPLLASPLNEPLWGIFELQTGYVSYVNCDKHAVSVITPRSAYAFFFDKDDRYKPGDFITFRSYVTRNKAGESILRAVAPAPCQRDEALTRFNVTTAVVEHVNSSKQLFFLAPMYRNTGVVVRFDETALRPKPGDCFKLIYCERTDKQGKQHLVMLDLQPVAPDPRIVKEVSGYLHTMPRRGSDGGTYGFVDDIYVPGSLIPQQLGSTSPKATGKALRCTDGRWRMFELHVESSDDEFPGDDDRLTAEEE